MKRILSLIFAGLVVFNVQAAIPGDTTDLKPKPVYGKEAKVVSFILDNNHYRKINLDEGMRAEEDVFSVDYDVWFDEKTNDVLVEKYPGHIQALQCGSCGFFTLKVVREEITQKPTLNTPGELIKHYECSYCKSVRATAFKISTMEGDDYKHEKHTFRRDKDTVLVKVEIKSSGGGSKFFEFGDVSQAQKFLNEIEEGEKQ